MKSYDQFLRYSHLRPYNLLNIFDILNDIFVLKRFSRCVGVCKCVYKCV